MFRQYKKAEEHIGWNVMPKNYKDEENSLNKNTMNNENISENTM